MIFIFQPIDYVIINIVIIVLLAVLYLIAVFATRWLAKIQEYSEKWEPALKLNGIFFGVIIGLWFVIYLIFNSQFYFFLVYYIIALPANLILGAIAVHHEKIYDIESYKASFKFVGGTLAILFLLSIFNILISFVIIVILY